MTLVLLRQLRGGVWTRDGYPPLISGREGLVTTEYVPSVTTTGVLPGVTRTNFFGDYVIAVAGTVIQNLNIYGRVVIRAANVIVRNCYVRGASGMTGNSGLIDCTHANASNAQIIDCTLIPDTPSYWWNAAIGRSYTLLRCHWQWTVDGFRGYDIAQPTRALDIRIEACYGGPQSFFSPDPNHTNDNRVHADQGQIESGMAKNHDPSDIDTWSNALTSQDDASLIVIGNNFNGWYAGGVLFPERYPGFNATTSNPLTNPPNTQLTALRDASTSNLQVTPNLGWPVTGIWFEHNWCSGSGVGVSLAGGGGSSPRNPGVFIDNIFDGQQRQSNLQGSANAWTFSIKSPEYGNRDTPQLLGTFSNNTNTATGGAARLGRVTA